MLALQRPPPAALMRPPLLRPSHLSPLLPLPSHPVMVLDRRVGETIPSTLPSNEWFNPVENERRVAAYMKRVDRINKMEDAIELLDDEELAGKTEELRRVVREKGREGEEEVLEEAFAVVREAAWRTLELRHYDVQLVRRRSEGVREEGGGRE